MIEEWERYIRLLLHERAVSEKISDEGMRLIKERYTTESFAQQLENAIFCSERPFAEAVF